MANRNRCKCLKWYENVDFDILYRVIYRYETHPVYGNNFSIHQPCFMCKNDRWIHGGHYALDSFTANDLFGDVPHPQTLNLEFVGCFDDFHDRKG